jgi:hypothetical protein
MSDGNEDDAWFAPKRLGYGAGLPITWQGWVLIIGFCTSMAAAGVLLVPKHTGIFIVIAIAGAIALNIVAAQHTKGGWKWRWGGED